MERLIKHKVWVVWLLSAVLTLPFVVKTVHIYENNTHEEHDNCSGHSHHDFDNCVIYQFTLLTFTEATFIDYDFSTIPVCFELLVSYRNTVHQRTLLPYGLRAPPTA